MFIFNLLVCIMLCYQLATYEIFQRKDWIWVAHTYFTVPLLIGANLAFILDGFLKLIGG